MKGIILPVLFIQAIKHTMATDVRTSALKSPVDVAEYLFRRLHELGIRSLHGVPGDYNLVALDYGSKCGLNWVGNCNELNAGNHYFIRDISRDQLAD